MPRPLIAYIHTDAAMHNLNVIKQRAAKSSVWAIIKASAYGNGVERVYPALAEANAEIKHARRMTDAFAAR